MRVDISTSSTPEAMASRAVKNGVKKLGMTDPMPMHSTSVAPKVVPIWTTENLACRRVRHSPHRIKTKPSIAPVRNAMAKMARFPGCSPGKN